MAFTVTEQEKKSMAITAALFAILFLAMFYIKFREKTDLIDLEGGGGGGGVTVNFGDSEVGSGSNYQSEVLNVSEQTKQKVAEAAPEEEIIASDAEDAPEVVRTIKQPERKEPSKQEAKPVPVKPQPSKSTSDALSNILNGSNRGGDGDDNQAGNKGRTGGDKNSNGYYGDGGGGGGTGGGNGSGSGSGTGPGTGSGTGGGSGAGRGTGVGNYNLAGRKALTKPQPKYTCNEQGRVAVQIIVGKDGKVITAEPGARGTTNSAKCLLDQARQAALNTKFDASDAAAEKQSGTIIYNFKLTE